MVPVSQTKLPGPHPWGLGGSEMQTVFPLAQGHQLKGRGKALSWLLAVSQPIGVKVYPECVLCEALRAALAPGGRRHQLLLEILLSGSK